MGDLPSPRTSTPLPEPPSHSGPPDPHASTGTQTSPGLAKTLKPHRRPPRAPPTGLAPTEALVVGPTAGPAAAGTSRTTTTPAPLPFHHPRLLSASPRFPRPHQPHALRASTSLPHAQRASTSLPHAQKASTSRPHAQRASTSRPHAPRASTSRPHAQRASTSAMPAMEKLEQGNQTTEEAPERTLRCQRSVTHHRPRAGEEECRDAATTEPKTPAGGEAGGEETGRPRGRRQPLRRPTRTSGAGPGTRSPIGVGILPSSTATGSRGEPGPSNLTPWQRPSGEKTLPPRPGGPPHTRDPSNPTSSQRTPETPLLPRERPPRGGPARAGQAKGRSRTKFKVLKGRRKVTQGSYHGNQETIAWHPTGKMAR